MTRYRVLCATLAILVILGGMPLSAVAQDGDITDTEVGGNGSTMEVDIDLSMFTNFPDRGEFGVLVDGYVDNESIITVDIAIQFKGFGANGQFFNDPLSRFATQSEINMDLSFLSGSSGDSTFRDENNKSG